MTASLPILWLISQITQTPAGVSSSIASVRLRCLEIVHHWQLEKTPINVQLHTYDNTHQLRHYIAKIQPKVIVVGKLFANLMDKDLTHMLLELAQQGHTIIMDVCDDIFLMAHHQKTYAPFLSAPLFWVASSPTLQHKLQQHVASVSPTDVYCITDPHEGQQSPPQTLINSELGTTPDQPVKLVWFGTAGNLQPLVPFLTAKQHRYIHMSIVSGFDKATHQALRTLQRDPKLQIELLPWSLYKQQIAIQHAHAAVIPCNTDPIGLAKTANRLMTSLWFGTPVIATPIPSYEPFAPYAFLNMDINAALEQLLQTPWTTLKKQVCLGQDFIQQHYSLSTIGNQWHTTIQHIERLAPRNLL